MKFKPASDDELRENGWDPKWIVPDPDREGPYAVTREKDAVCGQCGNTTLGWSVINLATATGCGVTWTHDDGEVDAQEHASMLNYAWLEGHAAARA